MRFLMFLLAGCATAQTADSSLSFEVASVKVSADARGTAFFQFRRGASQSHPGADPILFNRRNRTLAALLMEAYGLRTQQIIGPDWLITERYDIQARVLEGATAGQQLIMLQNLLAERFSVKQHREARDLPVYEMVVAKRGSKLKEPGAEPLRAMQVTDAFEVGEKDGARVLSVNARGSLETLAALLSRVAGRLILDRTELKGEYDIALIWSPGGGPQPSPDDTSAPGITLDKAMETQLGLRLEAKKEPVEVMVVDHASKVPTAN